MILVSFGKKVVKKGHFDRFLAQKWSKNGSDSGSTLNGKNGRFSMLILDPKMGSKNVVKMGQK